MSPKRSTFALLLLAAVLAVYSNHFRNAFQFDDFYAVVHNPAIAQRSTMWRAFVDATLFSSAPGQRTYRPVTTASLALDYRLAGGPGVFYFHLSTFCWYCVLLLLMLLLFHRLLEAADPHPANFWIALAATAAFGLHPANAETVNYVIQRGDLYDALGCVAGLWLFVGFPAQRRFAWYLFPAALAILAKPPALVFPLLLLAYLFLFERQGRPWRTLRLAVPAIALAAALSCLLVRMQPASWIAGAASPALYRLAQPFAAWHYFRTFFWPAGLNVDYGWHYLPPLGARAVLGYLFAAGMGAAVWIAARTRAGKPIAFGILWFLLALLPTSLLPLADIANDHRMFFAFVGLTLAVFSALRLALFHLTERLTARPRLARAAVAALAVVLLAAGVATRERNRVWSTPRSLWADSLAKNPRNARALTNYAYALYAAGDDRTALSYWDRATAIDPTCDRCESDAAVAAIRLNDPNLTEHYLRKLLAVYPARPQVYSFYADWLASHGRFDQALPLLDRARVLDGGKSPELRRVRARVIDARHAATRTALLRALDTDRDGRLSAIEIGAAPDALLALDQNGDGRLNGAECGIRADIARWSPLFAALDADGDGEISAVEIRHADRELARLDRNRDGALDPSEMAPDSVCAAADEIVAHLDAGHDGRIERSEWPGDLLGSLLDAADLSGDGTVGRNALVAEVFYRADRNRDGVVTPQEMAAAVQAGILGPIRPPGRR